MCAPEISIETKGGRSDLSIRWHRSSSAGRRSRQPTCSRGRCDDARADLRAQGRRPRREPHCDDHGARPLQQRARDPREERAGRGRRPRGPPSLFVLGLGMGLTMTPAAASMTEMLPADEQGVASALNDATREVGVAVATIPLVYLIFRGPRRGSTSRAAPGAGLP